MPRMVFELAYDGQGYSGFAPQDNARTVGGVLAEAIAHVDPQRGKLSCSSRTDAGVHARHQIVSFTTEKSIQSRGWVLALQQFLPEDISVIGAGTAPDDFDPRRDPVWKRYRYRVLQSPVSDPFLVGRAFRVLQPLELDLMQEEARSLVGEHDFGAFRSARDARESSVRILHEVRVLRAPDDSRLVDIVVVGNRFLYNMVRIIAGTLIDIGRGRKPAGSCARALVSQRRDELGLTAPAAGLYLEHVELATPLQNRWPEVGRPR